MGNARKFIEYIWNKHTSWLVFWAILSVGIGSSSTIWLAELLEGGSVFIFLPLLVGSYLLYSVPEIIVAKETEMAEFDANEHYIEKFQKKHKSSPNLILDKTTRDKYEAWILKESRAVMREAQNLVYASIYSSSSILLDAIVMAITIDPLFVAGYVGSAIFYAGTTLLFKNRIKEQSKKTMGDSLSLDSVMLSAISNIITGNEYNLGLWSRKFKIAYKDSRDSTVNMTRTSKLIAVAQTVFASLPILGTTIWLLHANAGNFEKLTLLVAIIPRQLGTIQYINALSISLTQVSGLKEKLLLLISTVEDLPDVTNNNEASTKFKIFWKKLHFISDNKTLNFSSDVEFIAEVKKMRQGRITIRGDNGSGKSVLMCALNKHLTDDGENTFYLPVDKYNLYFETPINSKSDGEKMVSIIKEIEQNLKVKYILLDEWDAHLDQKNKSIISDQIDKLAQKACVVEIRHKGSNALKEEETPEEFDLSGDSIADKPILISFQKRRVESEALYGAWLGNALYDVSSRKSGTLEMA